MSSTIKKRFLAWLVLLAVPLISYFFPGVWPASVAPIIMAALVFGFIMIERLAAKKKAAETENKAIEQ